MVPSGNSDHKRGLWVPRNGAEYHLALKTVVFVFYIVEYRIYLKEEHGFLLRTMIWHRGYASYILICQKCVLLSVFHLSVA